MNTTTETIYFSSGVSPDEKRVRIETWSVKKIPDGLVILHGNRINDHEAVYTPYTDNCILERSFSATIEVELA